MSEFRKCSLIVSGKDNHFDKAYNMALSLFHSEDIKLVTNVVQDKNFKHFAVFTGGDEERCHELNGKIKKILEFLKSDNCINSDGSSLIDWVLI